MIMYGGGGWYCIHICNVNGVCSYKYELVNNTVCSVVLCSIVNREASKGSPRG